ncbi:MAG: FAD/NAD(P)-binding protein [Wenzhouxiangella sp.]
MDTPDIVLIGCGASGALLAGQIFRQAQHVVRISCVDPRFRLGAGLAYGAARDEHLLNVPASRMSAWPDQPDHFADWLMARRLSCVPPAEYFAPRRQYADYLTDCLGESLRLSPLHHGLHHEPHQAVSLKPAHGGWLLNLEDGTLVWSKAVVLALGNLTPLRPPAGLETVVEHPAYVHEPWSDAGRVIDIDDAVAIIGSGLTAVDQILSLHAARHRGPIHVYSRSGQWPDVHVLSRPPIDIGLRSGSLADLLRDFRRGVRRELAKGAVWQQVVDGLRPHTAVIWQQLTEAEKRRFVRFLASPWNRARHRMAPEVRAQLDRLERSGQLTLATCSALKARPQGRLIELDPGDGARARDVHKVLNCTGATARVSATAQPLLAQLMEDGLVKAGPAGLGLANDADGRVINGNGLAQSGLWTIGPMRQGNLWESTAIPEIRQQAEALAGQMLRQVGSTLSSARAV